MDASTIKGLAVVSMSEGTNLGRVDDVLIGPQGLRVVGLRVSGPDQTFAIPFDKIAHIGADAVTVESSRVTQMMSTGDVLSGLPGLSEFTKLKVVDAAGALVGVVAGLDIDVATGRLLSLAVRKGGMLGMGVTTTTVSADAVQTIGPELITLTGGGAAAVAPQ
jgi:sporulation protein YlmC with PRC-barrel domain